MNTAAGKILDPICEMIVVLADARTEGLTLRYQEREYGFCSAGCQAAFTNDPKSYVPKIEAWLAGRDPEHGDHGEGARAATEDPTIDAGMRAWYKACRCCLSDAYPTVARALDAEHAATD